MPLWKTAKAEHIGGRAEQQDRSVILVPPQADRCLLVVADGMGGHRGGALAAQAVVDTARAIWENQPGVMGRPVDLLEHIVLSAHHAVNAVGEAHGLNPHSTCVLLLLEGERAWWSHVGDSRLYHFHADRLQGRTRDHSLVQMWVDMGRIREEDMGSHQDQGCLLRGLGGYELPEIEHGEAVTQAGDGFVLCSDGVWEHASVEEMQQSLRAPDLEPAAQALVRQARERGGKTCDNLSLLLARRLA
jgi:serine/threonine protein phosphatase PrpC